MNADAGYDPICTRKNGFMSYLLLSGIRLIRVLVYPM